MVSFARYYRYFQELFYNSCVNGFIDNFLISLPTLMGSFLSKLYNTFRSTTVKNTIRIWKNPRRQLLTEVSSI